MDAGAPPPWGAPGRESTRGPVRAAPLPPRTRFEPTVLLTSPGELLRLRESVRSRIHHAAPARQRRLAELADVGEGFAVLGARELERSLRRAAAPAAARRPDSVSVVALGSDGPALAAERADSLPIARWEDVASIQVATVALGARRVRALALGVLAPGRRRRRTVLVPLVVASPGPLGWGVADDRTFLRAHDRLLAAWPGSAS